MHDTCTLKLWQVIIAHTVPWGKANLNYTGQALIISSCNLLMSFPWLFVSFLGLLLFFLFICACEPNLLLTSLYPAPFCLLFFSFFWDSWGECMDFLGKYPLMDLVSICHSSHSFVLIWSISLLPTSVHFLLKWFKVSGIYSLWRLLFLEMLQHQLQPTSLLRSKLFWSAFIKPHMQQLLKGSVLLPGLKLPEDSAYITNPANCVEKL